ncbi:hypothetical protein [Deinococcus maricopensis]|uniref:Uncharacterized protein n=1 Tax=Deinococcus maricopensis (strain DSM 21211 / LMG 22137 / NRRL B-23946 / LB-34) TaxID=709986 RepID=E8UB29_DEIML|nr:hypothetical protein [Deinococcus maricopensis]ADV68268.1 hypothetical protein Deima_2635 [Deinococcus maricopensis DSM 21211]
MTRTALLLLLAVTLGGCRYTFVPLIPPEVRATMPVRLTEGTLTRTGDTLTARARLDPRTLPAGTSGGYLSVVWALGDRELARDSVYLDAAQTLAEFRLAAPDKGNYRATLLWDGAALRQLDLREGGEF